MERKPIEIPSLQERDFEELLPPSLIYPGLADLFGHYSRIYLKNIVSKMNAYNWFRFVEAESKSHIFKKMATRTLYKMLGRRSQSHIGAGNENALLVGNRARGITSRGVNYKSVNEDGIGIFERGQELLLVACDGVGDCLVGEVASYVILNEFLRTPQKPISEVFSGSVEVLIELAERNIKEIPEFITFPNDVSQAAVTAVSIKGDQCEIAQVGDVLLFHFRDGNLQLLGQNRKWLDMDQLKRLFSDEQYLSQRHIISNAVGKNYDPYWIPTFLNLRQGDCLILATDGLETLHPEDVQSILKTSTDAQFVLETLYDRVIDANLKWNTLGSPIYTKPDNISIIYYRHETGG